MIVEPEVQNSASIEISIEHPLTEKEYKKLLKQSCDRGFMLFLKSLIPFYNFRYWNTRFSQGAFIWLLLLSLWGANVSNAAYQKKCRPDENTCQFVQTSLHLSSALIWISGQIVFGIYGGHKAKTARERLNLSRDLALKNYNLIK